MKFGFKVNITKLGGEIDLGTLAFTVGLTTHLYIQIGSSINLIESKPEVVVNSSYDLFIQDDAQEVIPLIEQTFEFDEAYTINNGDVVRVYVKFDSVRILERPDDRVFRS